MDEPTVSVLENSDSILVQLCGHVRIEVAEQLRRQLLAAGTTKSLFIDWSLAEHVDACVLQVLLSQYKLLKTHSLLLYVANDNPDVRGYLARSGLSEYFPPRGNTPTPNLGETNNV